jgi:hypothetical protein
MNLITPSPIAPMSLPTPSIRARASVGARIATKTTMISTPQAQIGRDNDHGLMQAILAVRALRAYTQVIRAPDHVIPYLTCSKLRAAIWPLRQYQQARDAPSFAVGLAAARHESYRPSCHHRRRWHSHSGRSRIRGRSLEHQQDDHSSSGNRLWGQRATVYVEAIAAVHRRQVERNYETNGPPARPGARASHAGLPRCVQVRATSI